MSASRGFLFLVLFAQLFMGCLTGHGILCIEPDGTVALEQAGRLCCEQPAQEGEEASDAALVRPDDKDDCCSCIDVALPGDVEPGVAPDTTVRRHEVVSLVSVDALLPVGAVAGLDAFAIVTTPPPRAVTSSRDQISPFFLRC